MEPLLTAREAADALHVCRDTVLDWYEAGTLPGYSLNGKAVRFRASELEAWLETQRQKGRPARTPVVLLAASSAGGGD